MYAGEEDVDRLSQDLEVKDLEKLVRRISSLSKKDAVPSTCRVVPYSGTNALPEKHQVLVSLPPLPEGGEVEERTVITDEPQGTSRPESEVAGSHKSAASSEKEVESEASESTHSLPSAVSPRNKRKRDGAADSGTSKTNKSPLEETLPEEEDRPFNPYEDALVSSSLRDSSHGGRNLASTTGYRTPQSCCEPRAPSPKRARTDQGKELSPLTDSSATPLMDDPLMKEFVRLGTQIIGYRDLANELKESLSEANKCADDLARKLEQSEKAREKAESDAAAVEGLRKRLQNAENSLSDNIAQQSAREQEIITRLESQSRRFVRKTHQDYDLENPEGDRLLDAFSLLEIHGDEARQGLADARAGLLRLFPYFFAKKKEPDSFAELAQHFIPAEDLGLGLRQEGLKIGVEGTIALVAESQQAVDWSKVGDVGQMETKKWQSMIRAAKPSSKKILSFLGCKPTPSPSSTKPEVK
ncbi:hypothetical protein QYE76_027543 [Lolium multiflorum]|uniref:Uncharacterized protein n=1 Tax=Lolium multiflorum TaxID=4521 RepID=A0AAD8QJB6_LOLMU|nr:hypothetical protein QYE76_027543 [Lolium multiflorum]